MIVVALGVMLGGWELIARWSSSVSLPAPTEVVAQMVEDGWVFYGPNVATTAREAALGFAWGVGIAVAIALVIVLVPATDGVLSRLVVAIACVPLLAIGPVLSIVFAGETPKVVLAALTCLLPVMVGTVAGLRRADRARLDVVRAAGGGAVDELRRVRVRAGLPDVLAALRIAAPSAVLGAMVGEYLGGERGLGVAMVSAQQQLEVARTWGLAVAAALLAGVGYAAVAGLDRWTRPEGVHR
ncbi:MAG TPA: ABC transporter permease subunit [Microthrixaceae bacterium]|nr:ABC transporter permease subunit [Microthrixaceae bacterium]